MIQYLVVLLNDSSASYCHYQKKKNNGQMISLSDLKDGIKFAMKENLMIQYVLPDFELPEEYKAVMNSIDSHLIVPSSCLDQNALDAADVIVFDSWEDLKSWTIEETSNYVLRTSIEQFFEQYSFLKPALEKSTRVNVVFTDVERFTDNDAEKYQAILSSLATIVYEEYAKGHYVQFNLLTDRMLLTDMNNCGAGDSSITLAPDGKFYLCPAFYHDGVCDGKEVSLGDVCQKGYSVGSLKEGLDIKNPQLYKLTHAPLCRNCDAYQCKRCIWLNRKMTLEVNTPSHEQCVMAHIERNDSRKLLADIRTLGTFLPDQEIKEIDYLDPFDVRSEL